MTQGEQTQTAAIPAHLTNDKVSGSRIVEYPRRTVAGMAEARESGVYTLPKGGLDYDFALFRKPVPENGRLFVFFSGFADRGIFQLPVFHRWSWHGVFPGSTVFFSDPALKLTEDLGLGWYVGLPGTDVTEVICGLVRELAAGLGIAPDRIVFYGSSGGGFAALRALAFLPEAAAIAINPQTRLTSFNSRMLQAYLARLWDGMTPETFARDFPRRNALAAVAADIAGSRIVYVQNTCDPHHLAAHLPELFEDDGGTWRPRLLRDAELVFFTDDRGHVVAEPNGLVPALLQKLGP